MTTAEYVKQIGTRYALGNATEYTYRGDLEQLIQSLVPEVLATNEPKRQSCGAPDYIITRKEIPIGYIEAKDVGDNDLKGDKKNGNKEQFDRYKSSLENLIFTDYLDFHLYIGGEHKFSIRIGELRNGKVEPLFENFQEFEDFIRNFCTYVGQTIRSSKRLAEMMAGKARMLALVIEKAISSDEMSQENSSLHDQLKAFQEILIHDINAKGFADLYSQTIAYGMFAARLHDPTLPTFSRQEAAELIPKTNPFLRKLFQYVAGYDLDSRVVWIVDGLADVFRATDVAAILKNFGKSTQTNDPIIHFYETFLSEYDPGLRKARGVWYTPEPAVSFIVRTVDVILKRDFHLPQGLADTSTTKVKVKVPTHDKRYNQGMREHEMDVHKVQILDPATGTGTFLAEVVKYIYRQFEGQQGIWGKYVSDHLIPRLNGFELLMASYAMAHLKLDLLLRETGFRSIKDQRFRIYLTNSLEEYHPDTGTLFSNWLSSEANEANQIKRDTPVMVVLGNPPYSVSSTNRSEWIERLLEDYKRDLNEINIQPLSDDYIKFIRFGQHFIDKNSEGVLAFITNNSFIDGIIHRQMRKSLLESFDHIYILDLHGSSKRKETSKDGSKDENIFDIQSGVSINIFIKDGSKSRATLGTLNKFDVYGSRTHKYDFLNKETLDTIPWERIEKFDHNYLYKVVEESSLNDENSFKLNQLFLISASGITTERDDLTIKFAKNDLDRIASDISTMEEEQFRAKYEIGKDGRDWKIKTAKDDILNNKPQIREILYRPFDKRYTFYSGKSKGFHSYPRANVMNHFLNGKNIGLVVGRQGQAMGNSEWNIVHITDSLMDSNIYYRGRGTVFPLYLFSENDAQQSLQDSEIKSNLNTEIINEISQKLGLEYSEGQAGKGNCFTPHDVLDYIYATLHSPKYRAAHKEYLKNDFPRIPLPVSSQFFFQLVRLGRELRMVHLLNNPQSSKFATSYPVSGDNVVVKPNFNNNKVFINEDQYFENIGIESWQFFIGGYQPAQKWLKDRKGRELSFEDIIHYQKLISAIVETQRLMNEIDLNM